MRLRPTVRGVGLAIGGVIAVLAGVVVGAVDLVRIGTLPILLVIGALAGIGLLDPGRGRHRLSVERGASPNPVHAGSTSLVGVLITATDAAGRARIAGLRFREQASAELSGGRALRAHVARTPGRVTISYPVLADRRGRWTLGPLVVTRVDPFGVAKATTSLGIGAQIAVWPTVTELQVPPGVLVGDPDRVALGARTPSTDDASLRDYRFGDDLRRVHWATSARRGELMVRSDERAGMRPVSVLLDLPTRPASLEWSISLAASMTLAMLDAGHPVRLLCGPAPAGATARSEVAAADRPLSQRHAHNRPGDMARADILDRTIDLTVAESPATAEERLLDDARVLVASDGVGEIVLAVLGPPRRTRPHGARTGRRQRPRVGRGALRRRGARTAGGCGQHRRIPAASRLASCHGRTGRGHRTELDAPAGERRVTTGRGPAGIPRGGRSILGSALVAAAACASLLALSGLLSPGRWLRAGMLAVVVLAIVTVAVRSVARSRWAPTIVGAITAALGLLVVYGAPPGRVQVLPDAASVERLLTSARAAAELINASVVPMDAARPVEMLVVAGGMLVFLFSDALALGLDAPGWSGFVLVTLWLPAIGLGYPAPASALGWTALAYLLLLALSAAPRSDRTVGARRAASTLAISAALVAATLVAGPVVAAAPGWASLALPNFGSGPIGPLRLSDDLDLRQSLGRRSGQVVLHYTVAPFGAAAATSPADGATATPGVPEAASARVVGPLRAFTLRDFDGRSWQRTEATDLQEWEPGTLLASDARLQGTVLDPSQGTPARVDVTIDGLREMRLPVSTFPRTVEIVGPWRYDAERDEVVGDRATGVGTTYAMTVDIPTLTADDLRAAGGELPPGLEAYLTVPQTAHTDDIRALAAQITANANGTYEQALALQTYFRDMSRFVYDTRVPPARTDDAVWDFLKSRHGYCVQFATSMAVMARALGIPARLGVGFLPGVADDAGVYTVTGRLSHTWPELYFPKVGWVRFEPTPAVQSGSPPRWSDPFVFSTPAPNADDIPNGATGPVTAGASAGATAPTSGVQTGESTSRLPLAVGAGLLLVLAVGGLALARRRSSRATPMDPEVAWGRLRERLAAAAIEWSDARTPRQCVELIRARVIELRTAPLSEPADATLVQLADALEQFRYAPAPPAPTHAELESWIAAILTDVTAPVSDLPRPGASASALQGGS